jgi:hypothetical protein
MLSNLTGSLSVAEGCRRLRLGRSQFWRLRSALLSAALVAVSPKRAGRPVRERSVQESRIRDLEAQVRVLQEQLELAQVREEIALLFQWTRGPKRARRSSRRKSAGASSSSLVV